MGWDFTSGLLTIVEYIFSFFYFSVGLLDSIYVMGISLLDVIISINILLVAIPILVNTYKVRSGRSGSRV